MSELPNPSMFELDPRQADAMLRFDSRLVNIRYRNDPLPILLPEEDSRALDPLASLQEALRQWVSPDPVDPTDPSPPDAPGNITPFETPARYGLNDAYRIPTVVERYQAVLPDYAQSYRAQFDLQRYPFRIETLPETGLPRYVTGYLESGMETVSDPTLVEDNANDWLARNGAIVAADRTRDLQDGLRYVNQVGFRSVGDGERGVEARVAQARYQQEYNSLPVYGGGMSLTLTRASQHLSVTNSFFPIPEEKRAALTDLKDERRQVSQQAAIAAVKWSLAGNPEFTGRDASALCFHLLGQAMERGVWGEQELALSEKLFAELNVDTKRQEEEVARASILEMYRGLTPMERVQALWQDRDWFDIPEWADEEQVTFASYRGSALVILPHQQDFYLAWRLHITPPRSYTTWQIFVDAYTGLVLGAPESLAVGISYIASSASLVSGQPDINDPTLTLPQIEQGIESLFQLKLHGQPHIRPLSQIAALPGLAREATNIAVHGLRCFNYLTKQCGVTSDRLRPDNDPKTPNSSDPLTLVVGHDGIELSIAFNPAGASVVFQQDPGNGIIEGERRIHQPSLDPEIIYHELIHAFMWRLNPDPFEMQQQRVPFARALLEGYAIYFARSVAAHSVPLVAANTANNDEHLWARGAYRRSDPIGGQDAGWGQDWSLFRLGDVVGEDSLAFPNLYPSNFTQGLRVYRVGMVWARALWAVRRILGPAITDATLLSSYPALVGWAISFETAADNFIDALRRDDRVTDQQIGQVIAEFDTRNILPGQSVQAVAETVASDGTVTLYAGGPRFLRRSVNGGAWTPVALPEPEDIAQGITALAASGPHLYAATENAVYHSDGAAWTVVAGWPAGQMPLSMRHDGQSLWTGSTSTVQEFTPGGQPHTGNWNTHADFPSTVDGISVVGVAGFTVSDGGVDHAGVALLGLSENAFAYFGGSQNPQWKSLTDRREPDNGSIGWSLCVEGAPDTVYVGTLEGTLWKNQMSFTSGRIRPSLRWQPVAEVVLTPGVAILCLAFHGGTLFVGTSAGLFQLSEGANPAWQPLPLSTNGPLEKEPVIRSLCVTNNHLLVGTARHGVWVWSRAAGNWQNDMLV